MDLALNNPKRLICHKIQPTNNQPTVFDFQNSIQHNSFVFTQVNGFKYSCVSQTILLANRLFTHR